VLDGWRIASLEKAYGRGCPLVTARNPALQHAVSPLFRMWSFFLMDTSPGCAQPISNYHVDASLSSPFRLFPFLKQMNAYSAVWTWRPFASVAGGCPSFLENSSTLLEHEEGFSAFGKPLSFERPPRHCCGKASPFCRIFLIKAYLQSPAQKSKGGREEAKKAAGAGCWKALLEAKSLDNVHPFSSQPKLSFLDDTPHFPGASAWSPPTPFA